MADNKKISYKKLIRACCNVIAGIKSKDAGIIILDDVIFVSDKPKIKAICVDGEYYFGGFRKHIL